MSTFGARFQSNDLDKKITEFLTGISLSRARALMLDYDGTLAPFCVDPSRAFPYSGLSSLLERLQKQTDTRLAVISGRPAKSTARLLRLPDIEIWGCHGLERLKPDGTLIRPEIPSESLQAIAEATELLMNEGLSDFAERKFASIAIHWRGREVLAGHLTRRVLRTWSAIQHCRSIRLVPFDGGIEITVAAGNKGDAVQTFLSEIGPDAAIAYLGDDSSDEDAFVASHGRGLNILVREEYRRTLADAWIRPPDDVAAFLSAWIAACGTSGQ